MHKVRAVPLQGHLLASPERPAQARSRIPILALTLAGAASLLFGGSFAAAYSPMLVWNVSPSIRPGLYLVRPGAVPRVGDTVVAKLPPQARALAATRRYIPFNLPVLKEVAATTGYRVCARGGELFIGGRHTAFRLAVDRLGRTLPHWSGCKKLRTGDYLLLGHSPASFDGRYFGPTPRNDVLGTAKLIWAR